MQRSNNRRSSAPIRSLLCFLQGLEAQTTTIELRNEISVHGTIEHVDNKMNVTITSATLKLLNGEEKTFEQLFIPGSQIRYVLIPDDINVMNTIIKQVKEYSKQDKPQFSKQKVVSSQLKRHEEERKMVREYLIGKGRSSKTMSSSSTST